MKYRSESSVCLLLSLLFNCASSSLSGQAIYYDATGYSVDNDVVVELMGVTIFK
jgi:hypothetical protein